MTIKDLFWDRTIYLPAEDPIEKGNKGKEGNQRAGNVANKENRLVMLFVIVMTIYGDVLAIVMRTDGNDGKDDLDDCTDGNAGNDDIDDGLNTWLAPLDAASRMFASSLFCEWGTNSIQIFSPVGGIVSVVSLFFIGFQPGWEGSPLLCGISWSLDRIAC